MKVLILPELVTPKSAFKKIRHVYEITNCSILVCKNTTLGNIRVYYNQIKVEMPEK